MDIDYEAAEAGLITHCDDAEGQHRWIGSDETLKIWEEVVENSASHIAGFENEGYRPERLKTYIKYARERIQRIRK